MCKISFSYKICLKRNLRRLLTFVRRSEQYGVILNLGCTLKSPGELQKCWFLGPTPREADLIALGCGQDVGRFLESSSFDSNVQPRWTLIESKLTSQIKSVNFLRGCAHSTFPVRGLVSVSSNTQLEHPEALQDFELFVYDWIIFPLLYLRRQEITSIF